MICEYTFNIGKEQIKVSLDDSSPSVSLDNDVLKALKQLKNKDPKSFEKLTNLIETRIENINSILSVNSKQIKQNGGFVANCTINTLQELFPYIEFPEGVSANILFVDNLKSAAQNMHGRIIDSNKETFFIIKNNPYEVYKLANYLRNKQIVENNAYMFDKTTEEFGNLEEIRSVRNSKISGSDRKIGSPLTLILDFMDNRAAYENLDFYEQKWDGSKYIRKKNVKTNAYRILSDIRNKILERPGKLVYDSELITDIYHRSIYQGKGNIKIKFESLYDSIIKYDQELTNLLKKLNVSNSDDLIKILNDKQLNNKIDLISSQEIHSKLQSIFGNNDLSNVENLLNYIFSTETSFPFKYKYSENQYVIMHSTPVTIKYKYGIEYDTIKKMTIEDDPYKNYKIYQYFDNGQKYYIGSRGYLTQDSFAKRYKTREELINNIDKNIESQSLLKNSFVDFKFRSVYTKDVVDGNGNPIRDTDGNVITETIIAQNIDDLKIETNQFFTKGQIIESLHIPLNYNIEIKDKFELALITDSNKKMTDFRQLVNDYNIDSNLKSEIINTINTPEKVISFIYKINEFKDRTSKSINKVLELINNASIDNYYIEDSSYNYKTKQWEYIVLPITDLEDIRNYQQVQQNYPTIKFMQAMKETLEDKFKGIQVKLVTSEELKKDNQFYKIKDANSVKAFIRDGVIYINTTTASTSDMLHEYTHLLLGLLRSNPSLRPNYEQLLYAMRNTNQGKSQFYRLKEIYPDLSEMDVMEETFAKLFSEYLVGKINPETMNIFESDVIAKGVSKLFNSPITNPKKYFAQNQISSLFKTFNQEIKNLFNDKSDPINFDITINPRKYSTWISNKIKEKTLIEKCI